MKIASMLLALGLAAAGLRAATGFLGDGVEAGRSEHTSYHASGAMEEWAEYDDGWRDGACKRWYPDGTLKAEGRFAAGRMQGEWSWYAPDGTRDPERSGRYENGLKVGD